MTTPHQPLLLRVKRRGDAGWFDQFLSIELAK
jgi:serine protease Do